MTGNYDLISGLPQIPIDQALDRYLIACQGEKKLAEATIKAYNQTFDHLKRMYPDYLPLDPDQINRFLATIRDKGTHRLRFSHLHALYLFLAKASHGGLSNPMADMKMPRSPRKVRRTLTLDEVRALFQLPLSDQHFCMFALFLSNGLRVGELLSIEIEGISEQTFQVDGKTGPKVFPLKSEEVRSRLRGLAASGPVFCCRPGQVMTRSYVHKVVKETFAKIGIAKVGPHMLRHTFATLSLRSGMDSLTLQTLLGHATGQMTREYVHQVQADLLAAQELHTPFAIIEGERSAALPVGRGVDDEARV